MDETVRIGKVTDVDTGKRMVRVFFESVGIASGWLKVLKSPPYIQPGKDKNIGLTGGTDETDPAGHHEHQHTLNIIPWFPKVGEYVVCLYNQGVNEAGFVLGAV